MSPDKSARYGLDKSVSFEEDTKLAQKSALSHVSSFKRIYHPFIPPIFGLVYINLSLTKTAGPLPSA